MKKRILSMAIVVVMIVAMIPAMALSTSGIYYYDGYDAAIVADDAITVDASATPDTVYLAGEKIVNLGSRTYNDRCNLKEKVAFESYFAADDNGVYIWFSVTDSSLDKGEFMTEHTEVDPNTGIPTTTYSYACPAGQGDRFEINLRADAANYDARALTVLDFDYLGQISQVTKYGTVTVADFDYAYTTNETGWVGEVYIPWTALSTGFDNTADMTSFQVAIQCNNAYNGTQTVGEKTYNQNDHKAYCYDNQDAPSAYRGMHGGHSWAAGDAYSGYQGSHFMRINFVGIKTPVVADALVVDGALDAAYLDGETNELWLTKPDNTSDFNVNYYTAATVDGLYVFVDILDSTLNKPADVTVDQQEKFQLYFQMGTYNSNANWGYIEMDYTTDETTPNYRYVNKASAWYGTTPEIEHTYAITEDGWTAEVFIPWCGGLERNGLNDLTKQAVSIMVQVNDSGTGGAAYSNRFGERAWYAYDGSSGAASGNYWMAPLVFEFDTDVTPTVPGYAVYVDAITLDGVKDAKYSELAVDYVDTVYIQNAEAMGTTGGWHYGDVVLAKAYYAFTDTDVYVFVEVYDDTVSSTNQYEYVSIYTTNGESAGKFNLGANGTQGNASNYEGVSRSYTLLDGTNAATANLALTYVGEKTAYTGYNVEYKMALSETDKAALAAGKAINVGIGVEINNAKADGSRIAYGYAEGAGSAWWVSSGDNKGYMIMPEIRLDKDFEFQADITAASVSLGESIAVNYYAQLSTGDAKYYEMKFDFNGETTYVAPAKTENPGEYVFTFDGIAPQCMGDNLAATLLYNGVAVDTVAEYSVFQNCMNIVDADPTNAKLISLVANLGAYGAAAQNYANYKTDALVNAGFESYATVVESIDNVDRTITGSVDGAAITAAGVYFDSTNSVYVKVTVDDPEALDVLTLTINGEAAELVATGVENEYIVYTSALYATEFDEVFTFVLGDGLTTQTVTYSVNAYCKAKLDAANANTAALAAATYAYGAAAEAYVA